jgi:hypothetical protein
MVAFTTGNAPAVDLLCRSPGGREFSVQVKSLSKKTAYLFPNNVRDSVDGLYFVLVLLPDIPTERAVYFVLNHSQLVQALDEQNRLLRDKEKATGKLSKPFQPGVNYSVIKRLSDEFGYQDAWSNLPQ